MTDGKVEPIAELMAEFMRKRESDQAALAKQLNPDATPAVTPNGHARDQGGAQDQDVADGAQVEPGSLDDTERPPIRERDIFLPHDSTGSPTEPVRYAVHWKLARKLWADQAIGALDAGLTAAERIDLGRDGVLILSPFEAAREPVASQCDDGDAPGELQAGAGARRPKAKRSSKKQAKAPHARERIYALALSLGIVLFRTPEGAPFAIVKEGGYARPLPISTRGSGLRAYLSRAFQRAEGGPPPTAALSEATQALADRALSPKSPVRSVYSRVAHLPGAILLDLGDDSHRIVRVTSEGWRIEPPPEGVLFHRHSRFSALPTPEYGAEPPLVTITALLGNILGSEDLILVTAWLFGVLSPGPFPIMMISASQGSGKTTLARLLKRLLDPVAGSGVVPPVRTARDLVALVAAQLVACLDNLSRLTDELSDALACVATGGDFSERAYYTNFDLAVTSVKRPVVLTSILEVINRGDLGDRCLPISPTRPTPRLSEAELTAKMDHAAPLILSGLLDAATVALKNLDTIETPQTRMADFARWVLAGAKALGFDGSDFLEAYELAKEGLAGGIIEADPVASAILEQVDCGPWEGSLGRLADRLASHAGDDARSKAWPKSLRGMAMALKRLAPLLEEHADVAVVHHRDRSRRWWTVTRCDKRHTSVTQASQDPGSGPMCDTCDANDVSRSVGIISETGSRGVIKGDKGVIGEIYKGSPKQASQASQASQGVLSDSGDLVF